ncbi:hypothetical protein [Halosimplex halobium]|uniref:hypothetical protein n=1 Tax=Halosimplex halobium TaxID=3396618 RepID=UPI003F57507E
MSDSPPLRHLDASPIAAVAGVVFLAAIAVSTALGTGLPPEAALAVVVAGLAVVAVGLVRGWR